MKQILTFLGVLTPGSRENLMGVYHTEGLGKGRDGFLEKPLYQNNAAKGSFQNEDEGAS